MAKEVRINSFYKKFEKASDYEKCTMLSKLDEKGRTLYTNDFMDLPDDMDEEERAKLITVKYYDFQVNHYVEADKVDLSRRYYRYMKIDYLLDKACVSYISNDGGSRWDIVLKPDKEGAYTIVKTETDEKGKTNTETIKAKP